MSNNQEKYHLPLYMMTSTNNIYRVDCREQTGTEQNTVNAGFTVSTAKKLSSIKKLPVEDKKNTPQKDTYEEQNTYLNQAIQAGFYAWSPLLTEDKNIRLKISLFPLQGDIVPFGETSYSAGLGYALSCSLHMALTRGWCEKQTIPTTPYFCTGQVSASGKIGSVGAIIKKVTVALTYITANLSPPSKTAEEPNKPPLFHVLLPSANFDNDTQALTGKDISPSDQQEWQSLVAEIEKSGGKLSGIATVSEGLTLILGDNFIPSSGFGIEQEPMGLKAISYANRRHFFGRKLKVEELAQSAGKAYLTSSALTVTGFSGSGKSSIVQSGLLPELMKEDNGLALPSIGKHNHVTVKPTEHNDLASYLTPLLSALTTNQATLENWLLLPLNELAKVLTTYLDEINARPITATQNDPIPYTAWILDQYEELFNTSHITPEQVGQLSQFLKEIAATQHVLIITIVRLEYYNHTGVVAGERFALLDQDKAKEFQHIIKAHQTFFGVDMASTDEHSNNLRHRQPLEERILGDVSHVPLSSLAFLLQKLYEQMKEHAPRSGLYTHDYYDSLQGIEGVMASQANLALKEGLEGISLELHEGLTHAFFEAFVGVDESETPIIKVILTTQLENYQVKEGNTQDGIKTIQPLVNAFMSKGLIIDCGNGAISKLKLSHDSIISVEEGRPIWGQMVAWFNSNEKYISWNKSIEDNLKHWLEHGQDRKFLIKNSKELQIGKEFVKQSHNNALKSFIKLSSAQRKKNLVVTIGGIVLFTTAASFLAYSFNEDRKDLELKASQSIVKLFATEKKLKEEEASRNEIIELEIKSWLINDIATLGLYAPDIIVINQTDKVRQIIRDDSLTFDDKQRKLDDLSIKKIQNLLSGQETKSNEPSIPFIIQELNLKNFIYNVDTVNQTPELNRLILETASMDDKERQYWFDIMPSMTEQQIDRLYDILFTEKTKLAQLEVKYQKEIKALNKKHLIEWQDFQAKDKGQPIPTKSTKEKFAQAKRISSEHVNESNVLLKEILDTEKDAQTWVSIDAYELLGQNSYKLKENKEALDYWLLELKLREKLDFKLNNSTLSSRYWKISNLYVRLKSFEEAIEYSHKSINLKNLLLLDKKEKNKEQVNKGITKLWQNIVTFSLILNELDTSKEAVLSYLKHSKGEFNYTTVEMGDYKENISLHNRLLSFYQNLIDDKSIESNRTLNNLLSSLYGSLSWYYLFIKNPEKAKESAEKGLRLSPEKLYIKGNLAHAHLFLGNYNQSLNGYKFNYKNKQKINGSKTFLEVTLIDFKEFKEAGLTHPDLDKMIKEVSNFSK